MMFSASDKLLSFPSVHQFTIFFVVHVKEFANAFLEHRCQLTISQLAKVFLLHKCQLTISEELPNVSLVNKY